VETVSWSHYIAIHHARPAIRCPTPSLQYDTGFADVANRNHNTRALAPTCTRPSFAVLSCHSFKIHFTSAVEALCFHFKV